MGPNQQKDQQKDQQNLKAIRALPSRWLNLCILLGALAFAVSAEARELFRYKDQDGNLVLSSTIPNERVKYGYDIVDEYGLLLKRVEPQLSEAAYQAKLRREAMIADCEKTLNRVLKLYQVESDIDYAEAQGLESIDQSIANIRANLAVVTTQREEFETQAAQLDIAGKAIPNSLLENIARAKTQEQNLGEEVEKRQGEKLELRRVSDYERRVFGLQSCDEGLPVKP